MEQTAKVRTCLGFNGNGTEAVDFYISLLPDSYIENSFGPNPEEPPLVIEFTLAGAPFMVLNAGPRYTPSEAASISVLTKDQKETDHLWDALTAKGGQAGPCGWLKDPFGVSWQIVPELMPRLLSSPDKAAVARTMNAMMQMGKLDGAALQAAFNTPQ